MFTSGVFIFLVVDFVVVVVDVDVVVVKTYDYYCLLIIDPLCPVRSGVTIIINLLLM